ncbi:DUF445 domain-containing protein [Hydrogenovibrio sp. SC-1]|uniref:DUF445 domain-containing protein n=1 Tax=Hydrogenovibrio sp. SC-1 TaxID=2065820 RepID=UPI000C7E10D9|nr:DUF445 domain-containing protein [Hydrogenovibrio sp. SC-1]PLA74179.1 DUF445 domain-containing protein [Hydrogenovibrio sp. SC-1]
MIKSFFTNLVSLILLLAGYIHHIDWLTLIGLFALSGALTNWLAIHMLFEKVPGLVGSGVIPKRFDAFKSAIRDMMMAQFFSQENIDRFVNQSTQPNLHLAPVIEQVDLAPAYDRLVDVILNSSFGSMLSMFGGADALTPLKDPFIVNMKTALIEITEKDSFKTLVQSQIDQPEVMADIRNQIETIIDARLNELTPQMVKEMVQTMIKNHLGWLVVWGGVFGGLIGYASSFML